MKQPSRRAGDEMLVIRAQLGGPGAFNPLYARWHRPFLRHAYRLLSDGEQAGDAVQDAWAEIVKGLAGLKDTAAFQAWAFRIVTRRCAHMIRRQQKYRRVDQAVKQDLEICDGSVHLPDTTLDIHHMRLALAGLSGDQRAAIDLFYLEDFTVAEVAVALDIPAGTVKTRLLHARKKLRAILEGEST